MDDAERLRALSEELRIDTRGLSLLVRSDARRLRRCKQGSAPVPAALLAWMQRQADTPADRRAPFSQWLRRDCPDPPPLHLFGLPHPDEGVNLDAQTPAVLGGGLDAERGGLGGAG